MSPDDLRLEAERLEREAVLAALGGATSERAVAEATGVSRSRVRQIRLEAGLPPIGRAGRPPGGGGDPAVRAIREAVELVDSARTDEEREAAIALLLARAREVQVAPCERIEVQTLSSAARALFEGLPPEVAERFEVVHLGEVVREITPGR